jgi:hypothetical protein
MVVVCERGDQGGIVDVSERGDQGGNVDGRECGDQVAATMAIGELQPGDETPMTDASARLGGGVVIAAADSEASEPWDNWNVARASACMVAASLING